MNTRSHLSDEFLAAMPVTLQEQTLLASLPDIVWVLDVETLRFTYISPAVFTLRGLSVQEAMEESVEDAVPLADRPYIRALIRLRVAAFEAGTLLPGIRQVDHMQMLRKDGSTVWVEVVSHFKRHVITGRTEVYGITRDITDRMRIQESLRLSEERHRLLAEAANAVVWTMALDGTITYVSPTVERIRGFTQAEAASQPIEDILTPESQAASTGYFLEVLQAIQEGRTPETYRGHQEYRCKDGSTVWCEVMAFPLAGSDGRIVELLGISRDINRRKRQEEELRQAHADTELANEALRLANDELARLATLAQTQANNERTLREEQEKLFAMLAHELKTPLATVRMVASSIRRDDGHEITRAIRDMNEVIERCVQSGQLSDRRLVVSREVCELTTLLEHAVNANRWGVRVDYQTLVPSAALSTDSQMVRIIADNLIDNAGKYSPPNSPLQVVLEAESRDGCAGFVFTVANLPGDAGWPDRGSLFEKYYRAPHAKRQTGAGLGLFLVAGLARLLGGAIAYEPTGTHIRFRCWLPARVASNPVVT